jgi:hypothetical protein
MNTPRALISLVPSTFIVLASLGVTACGGRIASEAEETTPVPPTAGTSTETPARPQEVLKPRAHCADFGERIGTTKVVMTKGAQVFAVDCSGIYVGVQASPTDSLVVSHCDLEKGCESAASQLLRLPPDHGASIAIAGDDVFILDTGAPAKGDGSPAMPSVLWRAPKSNPQALRRQELPKALAWSSNVQAWGPRLLLSDGVTNVFEPASGAFAQVAIGIFHGVSVADDESLYTFHTATFRRWQWDNGKLVAGEPSTKWAASAFAVPGGLWVDWGQPLGTTPPKRAICSDKEPAACEQAVNPLRGAMADLVPFKVAHDQVYAVRRGAVARGDVVACSAASFVEGVCIPELVYPASGNAVAADADAAHLYVQSSDGAITRIARK